MSIEIKVPKLHALKAKVGHWYIQINEVAPRGSTLVELIVQNQVIPVLVPQAGILKKIFFAEGEVVVPGEVLALIETGLPDLVSKDGTIYLINYRADMTRQTEYDTRLLLREGEAKLAKGFNSILALPQIESNERSEMGMGQAAEMGMRKKTHPKLANSQQFDGNIKDPTVASVPEKAQMNPQITPNMQPRPNISPSPTPTPTPFRK